MNVITLFYFPCRGMSVEIWSSLNMGVKISNQSLWVAKIEDNDKAKLKGKLLQRCKSACFVQVV